MTKLFQGCWIDIQGTSVFQGFLNCAAGVFSLLQITELLAVISCWYIKVFGFFGQPKTIKRLKIYNNEKSSPQIASRR